MNDLNRLICAGLFLCLGFVAHISHAAPSESVAAAHVKVNFDGIPKRDGEAIAETLSAARDVYLHEFGFDMPEAILAAVECGQEKGSRLYTDGVDRVVLSLPSAEALARPERSGVFAMYGMCHEMGHMAMYRILSHRDWMTTAAAEGWAHYAGSVVVDEVYKAKGAALWAIDPYDYRADGLARLNRQLAGKSKDGTTVAAGTWRDLEPVIGRRGFRKLFEAWQHAQAESTDNGSRALRDALVATLPEKQEALQKWWTDASPLFFKATEASGFAKSELPRSQLEGHPLKLAYDDGAADGKKSIAGGGHATKFRAPATGDWYLTSVSVHGSRYGADRQGGDAHFEISLCDESMRPIATWKQPFTLFARGSEKFVRMETPPTRVPPSEGGFYICLNFRPTAGHGVFVSLDTHSGGKGESRSATPGEMGNPLPKGDWMIRVELDRAREADALNGKQPPTGAKHRSK